MPSTLLKHRDPGSVAGQGGNEHRTATQGWWRDKGKAWALCLPVTMATFPVKRCEMPPSSAGCAAWWGVPSATASWRCSRFLVWWSTSALRFPFLQPPTRSALDSSSWDPAVLVALAKICCLCQPRSATLQSSEEEQCHSQGEGEGTVRPTQVCQAGF